MESQNNGSFHIVHTDPADLLMLVSGLLQIAAVIRCQEVSKGCGSRQVGVDLNEVFRTIAISQRQTIFCRFCHIRFGGFFRFYRLGNFRNLVPTCAVPDSIEGFCHQESLIAPVDHRILHNGQKLAIVVCFQGDGGIAGITHKQRLSHYLSIQHYGSFEAQCCIIFCHAKIVNISKLHHFAGGIAILQCALVLHHQLGAVRQGYILRCRSAGNLGNRHPAASVPSCIEGLCDLYGNAVCIENRILHNGQNLAIMGYFDADCIGIGVANPVIFVALELLAVQKNCAGEVQGSIIGSNAKIIEVSELHQFAGAIVVNEFPLTGAHHRLTAHSNGIICIFQVHLTESHSDTCAHAGEAVIGSENKMQAFQFSGIRGNIHLKFAELSGVGFIQPDHTQLFAAVIEQTDLIIVCIADIHMHDQRGIFALFLGLRELEPHAGHNTPGAGANIHLQTFRSDLAGHSLGAITCVGCCIAEFQHGAKQLCIQSIVKFCNTVAGIQAINTGHCVRIQFG